MLRSYWPRNKYKLVETIIDENVYEGLEEGISEYDRFNAIGEELFKLMTDKEKVLVIEISDGYPEVDGSNFKVTISDGEHQMTKSSVHLMSAITTCRGCLAKEKEQLTIKTVESTEDVVYTERPKISASSITLKKTPALSIKKGLGLVVRKPPE